MKKTSLLFLLGTGVILCFGAASLIQSGGMTQYTNSPEDTPGDCTGCHSGGSATPVVHFSSVPAFGSGMTYMPGITYTISYNVTGYPYFGFDLEMLSTNTTAGVDKGTFGTAVANCKIVAATNLATGTGATTNVEHMAAIPTASSASWKWTAPASGNVYVYSTALGAPVSSGSQSNCKMVQFNTIIYPSPTAVIENAAKAFNLNVFPNPATDNLHLTYSLNKRSAVLIQLYDLQGKMVADLFNQTLEQGDQDLNLPVPSSVSKGVYTLQLSVDGVPSVKKIVIQ
ncbi:MAG: T9SS type A sorting domain-containing protein [Bacteroidia bacterium]